MIIYDPRYHTFQSWSALMCEAYADQQLMISVSEDDWVKWAEMFVGIQSVSKDGLPLPKMYNSWDKWATALVHAISNGVQ